MKGKTSTGFKFEIPDEALDDTNTVDIFLHNIIKSVILFKGAFENWVGIAHNKPKTYCQNGYNRNINQRQLIIYAKCHNKRKGLY